MIQKHGFWNQLDLDTSLDPALSSWMILTKLLSN